ncbi:MAG TPA: 2,3-bisphosphoglycerate-independent phosphoglycerate mutase [Patescibacteria group bacterium]|nr:2,3-bisphosphoglycerate-independent phosphoglycerate mutase [Patescibacteria group bacterium]
MSKTPKPIILMILDGWGEWNTEKGNPVFKAELPTYSKLNQYYPKVLLQASGMSVGLPWGVMGNSEVGHQTLGSGQIIYQFLPTINAAISDGSFFDNEILLKTLEHTKKNDSDLHLVGLVSDGGVHSDMEHLVALLGFAQEQGLKNVYIHAITDGRDTDPKSATNYITSLQESIKEIGVGTIATLSGRYYTMDRNKNWDRLEKSFLAFTQGKGVQETDPIQAIENQYQKDITDEYLEPVVLTDDSGKPRGLIKDNDAVVCFNFRKDRSRQIARALSVKDFNEFKEVKPPQNIKFVGFTKYEEALPIEAVFHAQEVTTRLGEILSRNKKKQFRTAETEKYAHVTYFFNGGEEKAFPGEDRKVIPSKNAPSYATKPEMSAREVTDEVLKAVDSDKYDFILVNYANPDMVGHTGDFQAGVKALEFVDSCVDEVIKKVLAKQGNLIITADHGNIEEMIDLYTGERDTEHSTNPVPCWFLTPDNKKSAAGDKNFRGEVAGMLVDIAPTILDLFKIEKPDPMVGRSLLENFES